MDLLIEKVNADSKEVLKNLISLYLYEFDVFDGFLRKKD